MTMTSSRPYLIRAIYEWIIDNEMTPYLLVTDTHADIVVPREFVEDGKIVLNISPSAVQNLQMGNEDIVFSARFSGNPMQVYVPLECASALYAKENGQGMIFSINDDEPIGEGDPSPDPPPTPSPSRPKLKIVK